MSIKTNLKYLKKMWHIFDTYSIYQTSDSNSLLTDNSQLYIYSLHKVKKPKFKRIKLDLACFKLYEFTIKDIKEPVGFAIIPNLPNKYILRYTPLSLVATNPSATKERVENADITIIYKNQWIEVLRLNCGVEIITDLGNKLGLYLG